MTKSKCNKLWCVWLLLAAVLPVQSATINYFSYGSPWRFRLGTNEASSPVTIWRTNLNDTGWSAPVATAIGYGDPVPATIVRGSGTAPTWLSVFMRRTFVVINPGDVSDATLSIHIDDGYIVWINGTEVGRYNVPGGQPTIGTAASTAIE